MSAADVLLHHELLARDGEPFDWIADCCESPMERLVFLGLFANDWLPLGRESLASDCGVEWSAIRRTVEAPGLRVLAQFGCVCFPLTVAQAIPVGLPYRLDFATFIGRKKFAVEIDGHDFHERTKEQAGRDKARDRALACADWTVLRFTGSEVWADPECVARLLKDLASREDDRITISARASRSLSRRRAAAEDGAVQRLRLGLDPEPGT